MTVNEARQLKEGDKVRYPADRGQTNGITTVKGVSLNGEPYKNIRGIEYIWVYTKNGTWPSHRIGRFAQ